MVLPDQFHLDAGRRRGIRPTALGDQSRSSFQLGKITEAIRIRMRGLEKYSRERGVHFLVPL
jgi:hypothetical protein